MSVVEGNLNSAPINACEGAQDSLVTHIGQNGSNILHCNTEDIHFTGSEHQLILAICGGLGEDEGITVRQLLALCVHLPVVDVTVHVANCIISGLAGSQNEGVNGRHTAHVPEVISQLLAKVLNSSFVNALSLCVLQGILIRQTGVLPIGILHIVGGGDQISQPVGGSPAPLEVAVFDKVSGELGIGEGPGDSVIINLFQLGKAIFAVLQRCPACLGIIVVDMAHVVPEGDIICVEVIAVRPLHAFSQVESPNSVIFVVLIGLDHVGNIGTIGVTTNDGFQRGSGKIPGTAAANQIDDAAVSTDLKLSTGGIILRYENVFLYGQTILHVSVSTQISDVGCFGVACSRGFRCRCISGGFRGFGCRRIGSRYVILSATTGNQRQNHYQSQKQSNKLLHFGFPPIFCYYIQKQSHLNYFNYTVFPALFYAYYVFF